MMHFQTVSSILEQNSKIETEDCINEKLMNKNVSNLIEDDMSELASSKSASVSKSTDLSNDKNDHSIEQNMSSMAADSKYFDNNFKKNNVGNSKQHFQQAKPQNKLLNNNQDSRMHDNQPQMRKHMFPFPNQGHNFVNNNIQAPYMYSVGNYQNNQNYLNYSNYNSKTNHTNNRSANIQQSKALNLHKLWPHSLKQQQQPSLLTQNKNNSTQMKSAEKAPSTVSSNNEQQSTGTQKDSQDNLTSQNQTDQNKSEENQQISITNNNKTPLCLVNELVRYNKIKHEYVLLDEIGPAHKKTFYILLKLGIDTENEETYTANGSSIKKTQHLAAELALKSTKFKFPVKRDKFSTDQLINGNGASQLEEQLKANKRNKNKQSVNPPTVRLNTLAMKLGLVANYTHSISSFSSNIDFNSIDLSASNTKIQSSLYTSSNDFSNNYTNFMTNEYKPFKYPPPQIYAGKISTVGDYIHNYKNQSSNFMSDKSFGNNNMQYFNDGNRIRPQQQNQALLFNPRYPLKHNYYPMHQMGQQVPKQLISVKLTFADKEFHGKGLTLQLAKHDAADKALEYFTDPEHFLEAKSLSTSSKDNSMKAYRPPQFYEQQNLVKEQSDSVENTDKTDENMKEKSTKIGEKNEENKAVNNILNTGEKTKEENKTELKSEVQLIHEYAFFLKKKVEFMIIQESGASHMKRFVTKCSILNKTDLNEQNFMASDSLKADKIDESLATESTNFPLETIGEGNSKRLSKKDASIKMLTILKEKFEPLFLISLKNDEKKKNLKSNESKSTNEESSDKEGIKKSSKKNRKSKAKNIIKLKKTSLEYGKGTINPISRLMQIQQAKKEPEPVFEIINGLNDLSKNKTKIADSKKRHEFFIRCTIEPVDRTAENAEVLMTEGRGQNKKIAKQKAAEEMLIKLGYQIINPILKPSLKPQGSEVNEISSAPEKSAKPSDSMDKSTEKNEKKVKFLDLESTNSDNPKATTINTENNESHKKSIPAKSQKPMNENQKAHQIKQQKLRNIQQAIAYNQLNNTNHNLDFKSLQCVFQIAQELLDSVKKSSENVVTSGDKDIRLSIKKFRSETAEKILKEKGKELIDECKETPEQLAAKQSQFELLNTGVHTVNYKKMLEYLAETIGFKVSYQSLLGRDGGVNSYVNLSIFPDTEKPLNGNGSTHIESSNSASLCALQYLANKHVPKSNSSEIMDPTSTLESKSDVKSKSNDLINES